MFIVVAPPILMSLSLCIEETIFSTDNQLLKSTFQELKCTYSQLLPFHLHKHIVLSNLKEAKRINLENTSKKFLNSIMYPKKHSWIHLLDPCNPFYCNSLPSVFSFVLPSPADESSFPLPACAAPPPAWSSQSRQLNPSKATCSTLSNITCVSNLKGTNDSA